MSDENLPYPRKIDLENCAREPIHIIGSTQEFGLLLVADPETFQILQVGKNSADFHLKDPEELQGKTLGEIFGQQIAEQYKNQLEQRENLSPVEVELQENKFLLLAKISEGHLLLDLEPLQKDSGKGELTRLITEFQQGDQQEKLFQKTARLAKKYFGYDRVMIYRFDEEWNGEVVAEAREPEMESWYGLHYPASDIPAQSRAMFLKNGMRMISDVNYVPVPVQPELSPLTGAPLNISASSLRAVSPIHIEYLKNMKVGASLTAAIEVRGKLWGLMACHHRSPRFLDFYQRENCHFLARMLAMELSLEESDRFLEKISSSDEKREQLVRQLKETPEVAAGLCEGPVKFTDLISCGGGAIYINRAWQHVGNVPSTRELQELLEEFLMAKEETLFHTDNLETVFPKAERYREVASGLLSLQLAENKYLLWFRPETPQTVEWGGDPHNKAFYNEQEQRLSPRKSFEKWTEKKRGYSRPWKDYDLNAAKALGENLSYEFLARQRNEIEALYSKLSEASQELQLFTYGLSHDLRAPIRGIEGLLEIILEDHVANLDPEGVKYLEKASRLSQKLEILIDDILAYSRMSHSAALDLKTFDTGQLIEEVLDLIAARRHYPETQIRVQEDLPAITGDRSMMIQLWANILNNALKYSRDTTQALVEVGTTMEGDRQVFYIKDNGIGFPEKYRESIFEPFKRAVGSEFEGTGIGLALVRKIIEKHRGEIWATSEPGKGSMFYFYL